MAVQTLIEDQFTEVEVGGDDDSCLLLGGGEQDMVRLGKKRLGRPQDIVSLAAEPMHNLAVQVFVREQLQA